MCNGKDLVTIENIIKDFGLTPAPHQPEPNEYTMYTAAAQFENASAENSGEGQAYYYRAMTAGEFEAFRFGTVRTANGHQGFASFRSYSSAYLKKMFGQNNYAVVIEVHAPNWMKELRSHGWVNGKNESGDMSWGIGQTQSNGWSNPEGRKYSKKSDAPSPQSIFMTTGRKMRVVNLIIKAKAKTGASIPMPDQAPWFGIFNAIDTSMMTKADIELLKKSAGLPSIPKVPSSKSADENGIPMDGNCLFHALTRCLLQRGVPKLTHEELRQFVCFYMENNEDFRATWGITQDYITQMKQSGTWGGGLEIAVIAKIYNLKIHVTIVDQGFNKVIRFNSAIETYPIHLEYRNGNHYTTRE